MKPRGFNGELPTPLLSALGLGAIIVVGMVDYATGPQVAVSIFYLLPIAFLSQTVGRTAGVLAACVAALCWRLAEEFSGAQFSSPWIPFWNMAARFGVFLVFALLVSRYVSLASSLKESEEKFRELVLASEEGVVILNQGIITNTNEKFASLLGCRLSDLIGKPLANFLPSDFFGETTDQRNPEMKSAREISVLRSDGTSLPAEVHTKTIVHNGRKAEVLTWRDLTQRKRAEEALRASEERYRNLFFGSRDAILITSSAGAIIDVNPACMEVLGYNSKEEILRLDVLRDVYVNPEEGEALRVFDTDSVRSYDWIVKRKDGQCVIVNGSLTVLHDDRGDIVGFLSIFREVTKERELERLRSHERNLRLLANARVQAQEEERRRVAREIHDGLGQLLSAAKFNVEVLRDSLGAEERHLRERVNEVTTLLDSAVAEARQISYNLMPSVLSDFGLVPALQLLCDDVGKTNPVQIRLEAHGMHQRLDPMKEITLYRIAQEALHNIVRHSGASEAELQILRHPTGIRMIVTDNGKGFRVYSAIHTAPGRESMGLFSMSERTEEFGGSLRIDSTPGKGTTLIVEIPLTES